MEEEKTGLQKKLQEQANTQGSYQDFFHTCPNCGYCPHCGRGGYRTYPYQPPYVPYTTPIWYGTTTGTTTCGGLFSVIGIH